MRKLSVIIAVTVIAVMTLCSCQRENVTTNVDTPKFLALDHAVDYGKDQAAIIEAFQRLTINHDKDGNMQLAQKSGAEVGISEDLYNFIKSTVKNSNKQNEAYKTGAKRPVGGIIMNK